MPRQEVPELKAMLKDCALCPRACHVDRTRAAGGFCGLGDRVMLDRALLHHGEEPPISGRQGAGAIFLSSCNLRCRYCQNYQISHRAEGRVLTPTALADAFLELEAQGAHNIEAVTPTPQAPQVMEALAIARRKGLALPFVYNCGGYESPAVIRFLEGLVDIYLPDFKYGGDLDGWRLSGVGDYPRHALASLREMIRQVGGGLETEDGMATRGLLVRHLVLPGEEANSLAVLDLLHDAIPLAVPLSIMSQYTPIPAVAPCEGLHRRVTKGEYERVVNHALDLGFETLFVQDVDNRSLAPDFTRDEPFAWEGREAL